MSRSARSTVVDIEVALVHETFAAWLVSVDGGASVWVPKSVADFDPADNLLTLPEAVAVEKGLV